MDAQSFPLLPFRFRDLTPHPRNAEIYDQKNDFDLDNSIGNLGILHDPIVHCRPTGENIILSGHRRINSALASGKSLDDTILCRAMRGLSEHDERALLIHANKQREKTRNEKLAEIHELISIGRELGLEKASLYRVFSEETPRNLTEVAKKTGLSLHMIQRISSLQSKIKILPDVATKTLAQEAFNLGKYSQCDRLITAYWNGTFSESQSTVNFAQSDIRRARKIGIGHAEQVIKAKNLEITMLKAQVKALQERFYFLLFGKMQDLEP